MRRRGDKVEVASDFSRAKRGMIGIVVDVSKKRGYALCRFQGWKDGHWGIGKDELRRKYDGTEMYFVPLGCLSVKEK
jgi:hypothetical protein